MSAKAPMYTLGRAQSTGGRVLAEYRVVAEDGTVHWLLSRGRTYQDPVGHPVRARGIMGATLRSILDEASR